MAPRVLVLWLAMRCFSLVNSASETREVLSLDGVWNCYCEKLDERLEHLEEVGLQKLSGVVKVPIPGSFIDFSAQMDPKSCPSLVWYERNFFVPNNWKIHRKIWLRMDGTSVDIELWINGEKLAKANKSYSPIECEVTEKLFFDSENRIAFAVDSCHNEFPGIPQSVSLRTVSEMLFIKSVSMNTTYSNGTASISYKVLTDGLLQPNRKCISVEVLDMNSTPVANDTAYDYLEGTLSISNCHLWWPMGMDTKAGYLYTLVFKLYYKYCNTVVPTTLYDVYRHKIGIRSLSWSNNSLKLNGRSIYLQGVETDEEWTRKPFNPRIDLKDVALLKWLNANVFAMKVAPSEEMLDLADELGLLVILGSPKSALNDTINRYRNHPSVILWSVSLEEYCNSVQCDDIQFDRLRTLDKTRPFTAVTPLSARVNPLINTLDIVSVSLEGSSRNNFSSDASSFLLQLNKPIIIMHGNKFISSNNRIRTLNNDPYIKSCDFQRYIDNLKRGVTVFGELFGNLVAYEQFIDESLTLVDGIFDRNREPTTYADFIRSKFRSRRGPCCRRKRLL